MGLITTAQKKGIVKSNHMMLAINQMVSLNKIGIDFGQIENVKAMTDVTGFGLLGHLLELCEGSHLSAIIEYKKIPIIIGIEEYIEKKAIPGGTFRNWKSYGHKVSELEADQKMVLCDPQTSSGLLVTITQNGVGEFLKVAGKSNICVAEIGYLAE